MEEKKERTIPVMEEELKVGKRTKDTGVTRVRKIVHEHEEIIDEPLRKEEVQVERVPVNRYVDRPVPVRHEGNATIIPVMEEVLVVEKRLLLKEELHIRKRASTFHDPRKIVLHSEEAVVEHIDPQERIRRRKR
ncbi:MAG TPA: YsnF/AvaK domain-containing protein [Dissulfurispiraceae bacterium]